MLALAREELRGAEHPSTSRLIAYYRGEIPPPEAAVIAEHLSLCEECTSIALDVAEFFADDDEEEEATPADLEASWQELRAAAPRALERRPAPVSALTPPRTIPRRSIVRSLAFAYGVAAAFAAVSIGLVLFHGRSPAPRPQVNAGLYDLTSSGSERGEGAQVTLIRFQSSGASALLILNPAVVANSARYGVRIRRADRAVVWRSEDLELQAPGAFHLSLTAGALPSGRYAVELYGITEGRERLLGIYWIEIEK
jgi:hypothetical protein